jgi:hypothetical protein
MSLPAHWEDFLLDPVADYQRDLAVEHPLDPVGVCLQDQEEGYQPVPGEDYLRVQVVDYPRVPEEVYPVDQEEVCRLVPVVGYQVVPVVDCLLGLLLITAIYLQEKSILNI